MLDSVHRWQHSRVWCICSIPTKNEYLIHTQLHTDLFPGLIRVHTGEKIGGRKNGNYWKREIAICEVMAPQTVMEGLLLHPYVHFLITAAAVCGNWTSQTNTRNTIVNIFSYLASLVVEPNQCVIPGQHLAVEGGVVLGWSTSSHRPADLDRLIQVYMSLLEWMRVGSAGEHSQRWRHWLWLQSITPTGHEGHVFLIQSGKLLFQSPKEKKNKSTNLWPNSSQGCRSFHFCYTLTDNHCPRFDWTRHSCVWDKSKYKYTYK